MNFFSITAVPVTKVPGLHVSHVDVVVAVLVVHDAAPGLGAVDGGAAGERALKLILRKLGNNQTLFFLGSAETSGFSSQICK